MYQIRDFPDLREFDPEIEWKKEQEILPRNFVFILINEIPIQNEPSTLFDTQLLAESKILSSQYRSEIPNSIRKKH